MSKLIELDEFRAGGSGSTILCYSQADDTWICGDSSGLVHTLTKDNNSTSNSAADTAITSMAVSPGGDLCALGLHQRIDIHAFPNVDNVKFQYAIRTALDITHISYEADGNHIFVSSRGPDIDIYCCEGKCVETKIKTMDRGVRTFAVTDDSGYICIADDSASVLIYALNSLDGAMGKRFLGSDLEAQVKDITSVSLVRDCFKLGFKISWLPHRSITAVAIPSAEGVTTIFCRSGGRGVQDRAPVWEEIYLTTSTSATLTHGTADINIASFSPNGRYLATADTFGIILIWEVITNVGDNSISSEAFTVISMINTAPTGPLFDLVWGPIEGDNYLMLASLVGSGVAQNVIDTSTGRLLPTGDIKISPKVNNTREVSLPKESGTATATKTYLPYRHREDAAIVSATKAVSESSTSAFSSPYSSIENITAANTAAAAVSVGDAPSSSAGKAVKFSRLQKSNPTVFDDDDDDEIQYDDTEGDTTAVTTKKILDDSDKEENRLDGDLDNDDEDTVVQEPNDIIANINRLAAGGGSTDSTTSSVLMKLQTSIATLLAANAKAEKTAIAGPQVAFQPSSTTFDEKKKRYMVWNSIGNITCMDVGVNNRIEIRFTNTQRNRADAFNDNLNFTKAALSYEGALFSTEPEEDIDGDSLAKLKGSTIYYHAFPGQSVLQGANETFTVTLNSGESVVALAVGEGWSAVATSFGLLRVYSSTGIPIMLTCLNGPVVCMCGYLHTLAVYYHDSGMKVEILEIAARDNMKKSLLITPVPLSLGSQLEWVGFNVVSHTLVTLDTNGILRNLLCSVGWKWTPVLDLNQAKRTADHRLWPVTVKGNKLSHVLLNGESRPATYPQPVTSMKIFKLPITEAKDGKDSMAQNDRIHSMLWEGMMTSHFEALKGIETTTGTLPEGLSSEDLQKKVDIQQGDCDKSILTLFQFACQQQRNEQAMGYAHRLRTDVGLQSATQIADHFGRTSIAAAVDAILTAKREMENEIAWQQQQQQGQGQGQDEADSNGMHYESQADIEVIEVPSEKSSQLTKLSRRSTGNKNRVEEEDDNYESNSFEVERTPAPKPQPVNPFAVKGSPVKRKSIQESMRDMKASPSPKKATLSRLSSFSQNARTSLSKSKNFL